MSARTVVVGVDGSEQSRRALDVAVELAVAFGAEVVAVHAVGLLDRAAGEPVVAASHHDEIEAAFEHEWCSPLEAAPVASRRLLRFGDPVSVVLEAVVEVDAWCSVVGRRGAGGRTQRLLGSTSAQLAERATVPVLIVP